jgi:DNA-binding NarL/FixJ family response regulator
MPDPRPCRIVVIDDHPIFLDGLARCLDAEPDLHVVGRLEGGAFVPDTIAALAPDLVLTDFELPGANGIEVTRRLRAALPALRVVILTAFADPDLVFAAMRAGAAGYLLKHTPAVELLAAVRRIAAGEHVLSPGLATRFLREFRTRQPASRDARLAQLSAREEEVLKLLATGETNRQIARRLYVSEETVKSHVTSIFRKLEVSDRTRAAVLAVRAGLVDS